MIGWIKISRDISNHWIWKDDTKLKWWLDMLITVNFKDSKTLMGNQLIECKRGQSTMSLQHWATRWKVDKNKVRNFFVLLEKDGMILHENLSKTTRITICNYDTYQSKENDTKTQSKRNRNAIETQSYPIEEGKEGFEENKEGKTNYDRVFNSFKQITSKKIKVFGDKEKAQLSARLKDGFTYEDIELGIKNCYNDSYHKETNHKYLTLEFILRQDKLSKFSTVEEVPILFGLELSESITWTNPENITRQQYDSLPPTSKQNYSQLIKT